MHAHAHAYFFIMWVERHENICVKAKASATPNRASRETKVNGHAVASLRRNVIPLLSET